MPFRFPRPLLAFVLAASAMAGCHSADRVDADHFGLSAPAAQAIAADFVGRFTADKAPKDHIFAMAIPNRKNSLGHFIALELKARGFGLTTQDSATPEMEVIAWQVAPLSRFKDAPRLAARVIVGKSDWSRAYIVGTDGVPTPATPFSEGHWE